MVRLFVAVELPPDALDLLDGMSRPDVEGLRWTTREQWHVTLRFLGSVDDVPPVVGALGSMRVAATAAVLGPQVSRFGQRVLHVPVAGLDDVAAGVVDATAGIGKPPDDRAFTGHVTLARVRGRRRVDLRPFVGADVSATWAVGEVCLFASHLHPHGARYEVVERFPLS
jgi:RNA 2',3'-cyclic 3'-phosphodiesterase